jgi:hypothetical protein
MCAVDNLALSMVMHIQSLVFFSLIIKDKAFQYQEVMSVLHLFHANKASATRSNMMMLVK